MSTGVSPTSSVLLYFLAIVLPPLAVFLDSAFSVDFLINICLTILGWIPGIIHAWYVISKRERATGATDPLVAGRTAAPAATTTAPAATAAPAPATTTAPGTAAATY
ncbi:hypothetical protein A7U60_g6402 [Sanghuangporus baumii]|uniref:Uncharacterized protein n=1 Tax=Sanghuangporus baumii TaxID=108892 RepID=A0A9Q5N1W3_SANBA|nr:hypothetical protein A7U60_g6402 [Sanghuangporus baumii]